MFRFSLILFFFLLLYLLQHYCVISACSLLLQDVLFEVLYYDIVLHKAANIRTCCIKPSLVRSICEEYVVT